MMMVAAIGEWVAGPLGAFLVVVAFFLPTALIPSGWAGSGTGWEGGLGETLFSAASPPYRSDCFYRGP